MSDLSGQRRAVAAVFFAHGVLISSWVPHIPFVKTERGLSEGALGAVLLALAAGAVVSMLLIGPFAARIGPHRVTRWTTIAMAATLPLPVLAPSMPLLVLSLALFGAALGSMDVAMNAVGFDVERRFGRPIMSSLHGMYSLGALVGALVAAALIRLEVDPSVHTIAAAALTAVAVIPALRTLDAPEAPVPTARPRLRLPRGRLFAIGAMNFVFFMGEGSIADWGATYLRDDVGSSGAVAALGFAAFAAAMAIGRISGDILNERIGRVALVRGGGYLAAIGLALGLTIDEPAAVIVGFALLGIGLANGIPLLFVAAAESGPTPSEGISGAATLGYLGLLAGPPLIGFVAEATSLTFGLALVAVLVAIAATPAGLARSAATRA